MLRSSSAPVAAVAAVGIEILALSFWPGVLLLKFKVQNTKLKKVNWHWSIGSFKNLELVKFRVSGILEEAWSAGLTV